MKMIIEISINKSIILNNIAFIFHYLIVIITPNFRTEPGNLHLTNNFSQDTLIEEKLLFHHYYNSKTLFFTF